MKGLIIGNITSGDIRYKRESYNNAEASLHGIGIEVINVFTSDASDVKEDMLELIMAWHVRMIAKCDAIILLDDWESCSCARLLKVITEEFNKQVLYYYQIKMNSETMGIQKIKAAVESVMGRKFEVFTKPGRLRDSVYIRMIIAKYLTSKCKMDGNEVCGIVNRDHSTVSYYLSKYDSELQYNPEFRRLVAKIDMVLIKGVSV